MDTPTPYKAWLTACELQPVEVYRRYGIPTRTQAHWIAGDRKCPDYVLTMLAKLEQRD